MAEIATIARPYANAVFEIARKRRAIDAWSRELAMVATVAAEPAIKEVIDSPAATSLQKANTLARVCGDDLSREGKQFVQVHRDLADCVLARDQRRAPAMLEQHLKSTIEFVYPDRKGRKS